MSRTAWAWWCGLSAAVGWSLVLGCGGGPAAPDKQTPAKGAAVVTVKLVSIPQADASVRLAAFRLQGGRRLPGPPESEFLPEPDGKTVFVHLGPGTFDLVLTQAGQVKATKQIEVKPDQRQELDM